MIIKSPVKNVYRVSINLSKKGFTLIELLTVVAIIAVLSVIAATIFTNTQSAARDGARRADLKSIANAYELNRVDQSGLYKPLNISNFSGGHLPGMPCCGSTEISEWAMDPSGYFYCITTEPAAVPKQDPATWVKASCGTGGVGTNPAIENAIIYWSTSGTVPTANFNSWRVCTRLEKGVGGAPETFCLSNRQ